ncbi:hypothetical protein PTTG_05020 [Puccinia triticina 1-1 BBBD Race 1]|uniref:NAM-associated domain-containing protein n=1 Tax=Puccinia triticina (isolate 1-1 / race 1 (BBBD)) TaxID=630390 RepID=A0A180GMS0_PUCT1|nr:hypothetical protein PTTG_05020 [Puccinia triticina 1-1 BBBD Race 1]
MTCGLAGKFECNCRSPRVLPDIRWIVPGISKFDTQARASDITRGPALGIILHRVNKYCGFFLQAECQLGSGKTCDEIAVDAKEMFKFEMGFAFNLDHCWLILHHSPKWQDTMDELTVQSKKEKRPPSSLPASKATSVKGGDANDEDNDNEFESLGSSRPKGRKAAKRRKFEEGEALEAQKELIKISREKAAAMQTVAYNVIMSKNMSHMDPISRAFYTTKKEEIAKRNGLLPSSS